MYLVGSIGVTATMMPEEKARQEIDRQLEQCGWIVQNYRQMNISAGLGVAVREFPLSTGEADYMLYANAKVSGGGDRSGRCGNGGCGVGEVGRPTVEMDDQHEPS
jgi:hypothetical protein